MNRAAMILLKVKLEFWSFIFQNDKLISSSMMKIPTKAICSAYLKNLIHMLLVSH